MGIIAEIRALRHITGPAPVYPQVSGAGLVPVISSMNRPQFGARKVDASQRLSARGNRESQLGGTLPSAGRAESLSGLWRT